MQDHSTTTPLSTYENLSKELFAYYQKLIAHTYKDI